MNTDLSSSPTSPANTTLSGPWLSAVCVIWAAVFVLAAVVGGLSIYSNYGNNRLPCSARLEWETCPNFDAGLHQFGLSFEANATYFLALQIVTALPYFTISALVVWRRSTELRALLFSAFLSVLAAAGTWFNPVWAYFEDPRFNPFLLWLEKDWAFTFPTGFLAVLLYSGIIVICYTFPDGRFVPRWTRWCAAGFIPLIAVAYFFPDTPLSPFNWSYPFGQSLVLFIVTTITYALLYRYRHLADPVQRQQLKWFAAGISMLILNFTVDYAVWNIYLSLTGQYLIQVGLPSVIWELVQDTHWYISSLIFVICISLAVFRYHLWDIDLIIRKTVQYTVVSGLGFAVYLLAVGATSLIFSSQPDYVIPGLMLIVVALIARPYYRRLTAFMERVMPMPTKPPEEENRN